MKRKRILQVVLVILGLLFIGLVYPLYGDLRHSAWLLEMHNETEPMFLSFFIPLGVFLLLAAKNPSEHRSLIAFAAWWNIAHSSVMVIETIQACQTRRPQGFHRRNYNCGDRMRPAAAHSCETLFVCGGRVSALGQM